MSNFLFLLFSETKVFAEMINLIRDDNLLQKRKKPPNLSQISISNSQEDVENFGSIFFFFSVFSSLLRIWVVGRVKLGGVKNQRGTVSGMFKVYLKVRKAN